MSCDINNFDGGTWTNPTIIRPLVVEGEFNNPTISGANLTNNITLDAAVASQLASILCPEIASCVSFSADDVAAVFNDCNGKPQVPGAQLATCQDVEDAIASVMTPTFGTTQPAMQPAPADGSLPTDIMGESREFLLGKPATYIKFGEYLVPAYRVV